MFLGTACRTRLFLLDSSYFGINWDLLCPNWQSVPEKLFFDWLRFGLFPVGHFVFWSTCWDVYMYKKKTVLYNSVWTNILPCPGTLFVCLSILWSWLTCTITFYYIFYNLFHCINCFLQNETGRYISIAIESISVVL